MAGKLSIKERRLIKARLDGKTVAEAAKFAGFNPEYTSVIIKRPEVQLKLRELLDKAGLTDECLSNRFKDLAYAKETRYFAHQGVVMDHREVEALETQRKTLEFVAKLKGHMVERLEHDLGPNLMDRLLMVPCKPEIDDWTPDG